MTNTTHWRKTTQNLAPAHHIPTDAGQYSLYPSFSIGSSKIDVGFESLAERIVGHRRVVIDGFGGVFWHLLRQHLDSILMQHAIKTTWIDVNTALRPSSEIESLVMPFLGGDDPIFGTRFTGQLSDFFDANRLAAIQPNSNADMTILYGTGAALAKWDALLIYVDVPKNEIQFRSRAKSVTNIGVAEPDQPKKMYKRFYFVDWVALNQHKADLLPQIDIIIDEQRPDEPTHMAGDDFRAALDTMSRNFFRVRPWFEPGAWGGQWIKEKIPQLPQDAINYAWSFELITPENGLVFESSGLLLEVSFDFLMMQAHQAVLGESADRFSFQFPIRFNFLDTINGGNLSLQCHPHVDYIRRHFGETFTQDETYYILDSTSDAVVYLGFQDNINSAEFHAILEQSHREGKKVDVSRFINIEPANKHTLFLIPSGTVHSSGAGSMVLEISATPYIFTFKMYDWMRVDLDGNPRPLNISRAFENLVFDRKGEQAKALVSQPYVLEQGSDWQLIHLPTHQQHFYDVHRYEFATQIDAETADSCHVMSLVEGTSVTLETDHGMCQRFNYAETFVVPAATKRYRLINEGDTTAKVIKAFIKPDGKWWTVSGQ